MYNGIGLATARGSGTNGYVQRNWAAIKKVKDQTSFKTEEELAKIDSAANRQPNQELLDHDRKRKIELKCIELEQSLEDQGYSQDEIVEKINTFRVTLLGKQKSTTEYDEFGRPIVKDTHQYADEQLKKNARLRDAFGISEFFIEGSSLDPERKTKEAALAQLKALQVEKTVVQTDSKDAITTANKDGSSKVDLPSKSPKHKKRKKKKSKSHKTDKEKSGEKKKSKKHKKKLKSSEEDSPRDEELKKNKISSKSKSTNSEETKKVSLSKNEESHKKNVKESEEYSKKNQKDIEKNHKDIETKHRSEKEDRRENIKRDFKRDSSKIHDKNVEESYKYKSKNSQDSKHRNYRKSRSTERERERYKEQDKRVYDKYSYKSQKISDEIKSNKNKDNYEKKYVRSDKKSYLNKSDCPIKESKSTTQREKRSYGDSDSDRSNYTPPPKKMNISIKSTTSKEADDKDMKSTKYTFSLRGTSEDHIVESNSNGRLEESKVSSKNDGKNSMQLKKLDARKTNEKDVPSIESDDGDYEEDIDLNIIKEITTEKIKKVFELHEKQEQALLHLKKKIMEKKNKAKVFNNSSESSEEENEKNKTVKRGHVNEPSSSSDDKKLKKKLKRSHSSSRSSSCSSSSSSSSSSGSSSDSSVDLKKSSKGHPDKSLKRTSLILKRKEKRKSRSKSRSISSNEQSRKKQASSSSDSSPEPKKKSAKQPLSSGRKKRSSDCSSSSDSHTSYKKKKRRHSSSQSHSSTSSSSSQYSRSSSSSSGDTSSSSSSSSKSRSASIPRRRGSPSFLDRRRITR